MKPYRLVISLLVLCSGLCRLWAEPIPPGYYAELQGLSDSLLKAALQDTISGGIRIHYGTHGYSWTDSTYYTGTWSYFPLSDRRADGTICDMYSHSTRYFPAAAGESACSIQIEHCLPKSWWGGEDGCEAAYKDLYNLNPADAQANGQKSNYPPGHVQQGNKFDNGSFRMDDKKKSAYGWACFEPEAAYRGDFARAYFYIATAYGNIPWVSTYSDYVTNTSYLEFCPWLIQVLLDWHRADPVDEKELRRQDAISSIQHNRNPYIDYPELVEYIWGNRQGQSVVLDSLHCTYDSTLAPIIYPEPADPHTHDTLIALPAITAALINAIPHATANSSIKSNGTASITMGSGSTDGEFSFSQLQLTDSALLVFRASVYNTASSMQLDIYADSVLIRSISQTVTQYTRNEQQYQVTIPAGTNTITIRSVGGSTQCRACMQCLYLLSPRHQAPTSITLPDSRSSAGRKVLIGNHMYISYNHHLYTGHGSLIR